MMETSYTFMGAWMQSLTLVSGVTCWGTEFSIVVVSVLLLLALDVFPRVVIMVLSCFVFLICEQRVSFSIKMQE